ncbi:TonB-dependent receptor [Leeuwenhoekiella marinoflava]|uniref:Iron complex outermembrane receptor protein n=2 Tax=Leeuwenhoekiella marinoflava TaxID=988 RepID=A0A4Q0PP52_9FLAO|nr:TonB-dependent receptor [Leeuwenhoekiella marinoflava]RXG32307.1 iron complex outermembrane receptor protein [Leeuwenhoekiella marinoflava]SHE79665.1 iron complex outermembrane recepter protein [Leeuwenhoekiella marinoflava DSM 3653]
MKTYTFLYLLLVFNLSLLSAQSTSIRGKIVDSDGIPLFGATVMLSENTGTTADYDGNYSFSNVASGEYILKVSFLGFEPQQKKVSLNGQKELQFNFTLNPSSEQLQEVEITGRSEKSYKNNVTFAATKTATAIKDIPQAVSYVTKEVFADQQAYRVNDVIKNISGVNMYSYYDDFTFRGFRSGATYINGLRVVGLFGPEPLLANIERVEVIKGPASAMFGNSIPGGVMNRVTKKPLAQDRKAINFTVGSYNTLRTTADFTGPINEKKTLLYRLNLAYENSDSFRNLQEKKSYVIAPSISFLPTEKTRINFDLVITNFDGKLDRGQPIFGATSGSDIYSTPVSFAIGQTSDFHKTDVVYSTLSLNHKFTDNLSFNASYIKYVAQEDLEEHRTSNQFALDANGNPIPTLMGMQVISRKGQTIADNLSSYFVYKANTGALAHKIVAGFDYNEQKQPIGNAQSFARGYLLQGGGASSSAADFANFLRDDAGNPVPNVPHFDLQNPTYNVARLSDYIFINSPSDPTKYYSYGIYIQDQIKWNKFQLLLGGRQEYYNDISNFDQPDEQTTTQSKFLPRVGLVYSASEAINIYGTYTESFQPQGVAALNNPQAGGPFDPVNAYMFETGAKGEFFNKRLAANLAVYYIENNNILVNANDTTNPDLLRQRGQEQSKGIELDVNGRILPNLSITANYAYNEATITESDNPDEIGTRKENAPLHQGGIFGKYTFNGENLKGIGLTLGSNFVGKRNTLEPTLQLPSYVVADAGVSYNVDKFNIRFLVNNVFDKTHWVGGYSYTRLYPGTPRNYLLSVGYTF